jgi:hypothetical protein
VAVDRSSATFGDTFALGRLSIVQLSLGNPGSDSDTFCVVSEHHLIAAKDVILATLIAKDRDGNEIRAETEFKKHC